MTPSQLLSLANEAREQHRRLRLDFMHEEKLVRGHIDWLDREPVLAEAVIALMPFVQHKSHCRSTRIHYNPPSAPIYGPCDCGLSAALAALEKQ